MKFLEIVEDLLDTEELFSILDFKNAIDYGKYRNEDIGKDEFTIISKLVNVFTEISDDISKIDEGKLTKRQVKRPASKIKALRTYYDKSKVFFE